MRRPVVYGLQCLFLLWHSLAILVSAAPSSYSMGKIYPVFKPYLTAFHLQNYWGFFSSVTDPAAVLRYSIEDEKGQIHDFRLTESVPRSGFDFERVFALHFGVHSEKARYMPGAARYLCGKHADLKPKKIRFTVVLQSLISPDDYAAGHRPMDDPYIRTEDLEWLPCEC